MSSIYFKIGELFKQKETDMVGDRTTQVNSDTTAKNNAITAINADKTSKFDTLSDDVHAAFLAKGALLLAKKNELASAINALLTNATAEVDSITELISYLNANNSDWVSTLSAKKTSLDEALAAHDLSLGDFAGFESAWGVIYTRSSAAVPSTDLAEHFNMVGPDGWSNTSTLNDSGQPAEDGDLISQIGNTLTQTNNSERPTYKMYSHNAWSQEHGTVNIPIQYPAIYSAEKGFDYPKISWANGFTYAFSHFPNSKRSTGGTYRMLFAGADADNSNTHLTLIIHEPMQGNDKCTLRLQFRKAGDASCQKYNSLEGVLIPHEFNQITVIWDGSAAKPTVRVGGVEVEFGNGAYANVANDQNQYPYYSTYGSYGLFGDFAYYTSPKSGNELDSLEAYLSFKHSLAPVSEPMFQDLSKNYAGGFNGESPIDSDYIDGVVTNTACYAYPEKYFKLGTKAVMEVTYAGVHASSYQQYFIMPRSKWNFIAKARNYHYVPAYQVRYSPGIGYGIYHRNYGAGGFYTVETGDDNFSYLNHPGAPSFDVNPGDTVGFIVEWDGTMKATHNGTVIFTYPDKLTEDFIFCPIGVFGDWKLDMSGHMVDFDATADTYGKFEGAELITPTLVEDNGEYGKSSAMTLGGINANVDSLNFRKGKIQIGSLQGAGSYIEFVNSNHPQGPNHLFHFIIDTDPNNYDVANSPYAVKRISANSSQFFVNGTVATGTQQFATRPFFGEWPYWHPEEYWETHGDDDTVANKTVGPCRVQLMEGNKLVWFVNDYPVWEQEGFDVTQKWYININNYHNQGASFENIKLKSVQ